MEPWHTTSSTPYQAEGGELATGILTASSGNVQTYALDSKEGIENQNPFPSGGLSIKQESKPSIHFPIPKIKLSSNDNLTDNLQRLQARRQQHHREKGFRQRRPNPDRPYLQHPKYLQYRARQRCDTGRDGKPVWDDRIEDAFQNALVNIEPMGRRKKSQRGRPHGRNELISEWILQETGEDRDRKQVSSHIQVLNTLLKGVKEWDALITASDGMDKPGHKYYSDSIEQMVKSQNTTGSNAQYYPNAGQSIQAYTAGVPGGFVDKHNLTRLSFLMWVSPPGQMEKALHIYSELPSNNATSVPMPLEDIKSWRVTFPSLRPVIDNWSIGQSCDIILLEASFRLMCNFPPRSSKLGISLELDFLHPSKENHDALAAFDDWTCKTHVYQHGRLVKPVAHDDCGFAGVGKVKPFFESKWWASTFTQLTEKRKMAEDSKSDGSVELANEYACNFFRGLSVMQEIYAGSPKAQICKGIWVDHLPQRRRMAILLWKFSQATSDYVGTTTWHRVLPPPERISMNTPTPGAETAMPNMMMDSMVVGPHPDNIFDTNSSFMPNEEQQYQLFSQTGEESVYHDNFMNYRHGSMAGFEDSTFDFQSTQMTLDHDMNISLDLPSNEMPQLAIHPGPASTNFFELPHIDNDSIHTISQHEPFTDTDDVASHQPLAKFDMNTHKMLQAQLGADEDPFYPQPSQKSTHPTHMEPPKHATATQTSAHIHLDEDDEDDEALRAALLAASTMSDLGNQPPAYTQPISSEAQQDPLYIPTSHPFASPSTLAIRPPLQTHHSFASTTTATADHPHSFTFNHPHTHSRSSSKNDFASVLANLQAFNTNHNGDLGFNIDFSGTVDDSGHDNMNLGIGMALNRPQSQPVLMAAAGGALYEEMMGVPVSRLGLDHVKEEVEVEMGVGKGALETEGEGGQMDGRKEEVQTQVEGYVMLKQEVEEEEQGEGEGYVML